MNIERNRQDYITHVDKLRKVYTIRVEIRPDNVSIEKTYLMLKNYLDTYTEKYTWEIQYKYGYLPHYRDISDVIYCWFMHTDDALAFMLKFNGKII